MEIKTRRLILRDFTLADTSAVLAYQSDPRYLKYRPWETRTEEQVRGFVEALVASTKDEPRFKFQLALVHDGLLIGTAGIRLRAPGEREAEFGCELAPGAWGQGYAEEASRALLAFGFKTLRMHRIFASTVAENTAAISLAERLGMVREGCLRENVWIDGRWRNTALLGVLEGEWIDHERRRRET